MATHVEIDISLPLGAGPDGHIALRVDIPDLYATPGSDLRFVTAMIDKLAEWMPHPDAAPTVPSVIKDLRPAGGRRA